MSTSLVIDFVSDVSCPWCAVGLGGLERALARLDGEIDAGIRFQPFELNPDMGAEGQDIGEHLTGKYGTDAAQQAEIRDTIRARGEDVGFTFHPHGRGRIWNTFDAHRLLCLAAAEHGDEAQAVLKRELLEACHGRRAAMSDHDVLAACAEAAGLDDERVREVLQGDAFAAEVRERERYYVERGIRAVPAVIVNDRHLVSGAQPAAVYEQALRQIVSSEAGDDAASGN